MKGTTFIKELLMSLISLVKVIVTSKGYALTKIKQNKVVVLANGPSLKRVIEEKENIDRLKETDLICVNYFCESEVFKLLKPNYYIISAPEFWIENVEEVYVKKRKLMYDTLVREVDWSMEFYIPFQARKNDFWRQILKKNKHIHIIFYNDATVEGLTFVSKAIYNRKMGMPRSHNILGNALMMMIWKGYKEIGVLGADHSWLPTVNVTEDNVALLTQRHFYEKKKAEAKAMRKKGVGQRKLHEIIFKFYLAFKSYFEIKEYASEKEVEIINLTEGSYIDAFERSNLETYLK
ncbi:MAG: hypothetical protein N4A35_12635 [Flavobacteriales bacterium]|jgi:hypothetical protein|nr:hypothetical protein [Flavobacteriales bacterium]